MMCRSFFRTWSCLAVCLFSFLFFPFESPAQELNINFIAVNASEKDVKEIEVKEFLPKELEMEDVVDVGELELDFDVDKDMLFVHGLLKFNPKESRTFKIKVKDVWKISSEEIELLKTQINSTLETLNGTPEYASASFVRDEIHKKLDYILKRQGEFTGDTGRRIEEYRANLKELNHIRDQVYSLDFLRYESKSIEELARATKTVKMKLEVKNPYETKSLKVEHKHYLPEEIRAEDVIDSQGFDVRFDFKRERAYLTKEEEFKPAEVKTYEIVIKDIWQFPEVKLTDLDQRAQIAMLELDGTMYGDSAKHLYDKVKEQIDQIRSSLGQTLPVKQHIGLFRNNQHRFEQAWSDFKRIEEMIAIVRAKKLEEYEQKKVKNVLNRLKTLRGLKQISEALFKKGISATLTWKIIGGTILFVATFTTIHFVIWSKRSGRMGEETGPTDGIKIVPKPGQTEGEEDS